MLAIGRALPGPQNCHLWYKDKVPRPCVPVKCEKHCSRPVILSASPAPPPVSPGGLPAVQNLGPTRACSSSRPARAPGGGPAQGSPARRAAALTSVPALCLQVCGMTLTCCLHRRLQLRSY